MSTRLTTILICLSLILLLCVSCGEGASPVNSPPPVPDLMQAVPEEANEAGHYLWAYYTLFADPIEGKYELIPTRQVTDHWNVLKWLEQGPCTNCVKILSVQPGPMGSKDMEIQIKHPFATANLTGFDVRGIAMFRGSHSFPAAGKTVPDMEMGDGELLGADGYTALYNSTTAGSGLAGLQGYLKGKYATAQAPNALLNGYMRHVSPGAENTRNAFYAGASISVHYFIKMPSAPLVIGYAVDASWAPPIHKPVADPMTDFGIEANSPEPWKLSWSEAPVGQGLTDQGGSTVLTIDVYDWQGVDSYSPPKVECPELFDSPVTAALKTTYPEYSRFEVTVSNDNLAPVGQYMCLISVVDDQNSGSPAWLDLTAYKVIHVQVNAFGNQLPVAMAMADPPAQGVGQPVHFMDDGSYDPDGGSIVLYEWDWNNDGIYDEQGQDVYHEWDAEGTYYVQFRVTDDEASTDTLDAPLEIQISKDKFDPVAVAQWHPDPQIVCEPVGFTGLDSYDPDGGSIVMYEWDWNDDGIFEDTGATIEHGWGIPGLYPVQLRVTDDEAATDTLDVPLGVVVENALPTAAAHANNYTPQVDESIHLVGTDSYDNDCGGQAIVSWDWDLNEDGVYDVSGDAIGVSFGTPGLYKIQLRVTDDEGGTDILDTPLEISVQGLPPIAMAVADPPVQIVGELVHFSDDGSYDPDGGLITKYEWDWDADGTWDAEGNEAYHSWNTLGHHLVQFRVTDDESTTDTLDTPLDVIVHELPVAKAFCSPISTVASDLPFPMHFEDNGSYDPDGGSIVKWEWDVNNDGSYEGEGQSYDYDISISVPGKHYFQCRVTDDEGGTDTLDTPLWLQVDDYEGWTRTWGADDDDEGFAVAVDSDGCSYVTGQFVGTVDFDPGPGVVERTSNGGYDIFLAKYGPAGVLRWVKTWGSSDFDSGYGVAVDNWPNVYVTGSFSGSVDFDTGAGTDYRTSSGYTDVFLSKFSADGEYLWSRQWGGSTGDDGRKVAVVPSTGVSYVCGFFTGTADFDPSPFITENHTSAGYADCFLSKVDSGGTYQWSRTWGGDAPDWPNDVACDAYWDPYVTGFFQGDVDFDPSIGGFDWHTGPGSFLTKFSSTVDFAWARTWGDDFDCEAHGVTVNQTNSDIYVSGEFAGAVDFDPDPLNTFDLSAVMGADAYVSCFNSSGVHQWAWAWGGIGYDVAVDIALDETLNSMIVTGLFEDTCDFDPGTGADWRACQGGYDIFMNRISLSGGYEYARTWGSTSADEGYGVAVNQATGNIFLTGNFMGSMDFDPGPGVDVHVPDSGSRDVFLIKLRPNGLY